MPGFFEPDPATWAKAVAYLRAQLSKRKRATLRSAFAKAADPIDLHFTIGMQVRNLLRQGGFSGFDLGDPEFDGVWADLAREAIADAPELPAES